VNGIPLTQVQMLASRADDRCMTQEFNEWVESITKDDDDDTGQLAVGAEDFFREVFDERGPVPVDELSEAWSARELTLAREAADLVAADIRATTRISSPSIEVRREDDLLIVSFNGNYQSPPMFWLRAPESICEVAENLRDHVMDEVWTVWPACPEHDRALSARPVDGVASWVCPTQDHVVARIGSLGERPASGVRR
jgi:hypothetical protein